VDSDTQSSITSSAETVVGFEDLIDRLRILEDRLEQLETLQKQDADVSIGMTRALEESVDELEEAVEKLENQVQSFQQYTKAQNRQKLQALRFFLFRFDELFPPTKV